MPTGFILSAAVVTPFFAKNEDRGYFRTALLTTPAIFAAGTFLPPLFSTAREAARTVVDAVSTSQRVEKYAGEKVGYARLTAILHDPSASTAEINRSISSYLVNEPKLNKNFLKDQRMLTKLFNRKYVITNDLMNKVNKNDLKALDALVRLETIRDTQASKGYLLTKALKAAREDSLTESDWAEEVKPPWEPPTPKTMTNQEMIAMFDEYSSRPTFVKSLRNRLREVDRRTYGGTIDIADGPPGMAGAGRWSPVEFEEMDDSARAIFAKQVPDTYQYLEAANKAGSIRQVQILSEDVVKGRTGRVLAYKFTRRENGNLVDSPAVPIVDETGTVRLSPNMAGVGDFVIDEYGREHKLHTWIAKQVFENRTIPTYERYPGEPSLQLEIARHAYWNVADPTDARRVAEELASGGSAGQFNAPARSLRSQVAKITSLPVFPDKKGMLVPFNKLTSREQEDLTSKNLRDRFINISSEAGTYEGRYVRRSAAFLSPYGASTGKKQDWIWRSLTKEFQLQSSEGLPDEARLGWKSTAWETLRGTPDMPAARVMTASIDPTVRTALIDELHASGEHDLATSFGRMGETGGIMKESFSNNFTVEGISKYNMTEVGVKSGDVVDPNMVMGFNREDAVVPKHLGTVLDVPRDETGFVVNVKHELSMLGAKFDINGVKGLIAETPRNDHFEQMRLANNERFLRTGEGSIIPENVNMLMPTEYYANKIESTSSYLDMGSALVDRLEQMGGEDVTRKYRNRMEMELATSWENRQLVIDAMKLGSPSDRAGAARLAKLREITEQLFRDAGVAIREAGGYDDPILEAYAQSGKELGDWMLQNQHPGMMFIWDHSLVNAPRFGPFTHDFETHMMNAGNFAGLKALQSRAFTSSGGDARQSLDFLKYVMKGDFNQEMGVTVPIGEAFKGKSGSLNLARNRVGTIFDSELPQYKENFRLDLGNGKFLPMPGTNAYLAEPKQFGPGEYQTRRWQHTVQKLAFEADAEKQQELAATAVEQFQETFGTGKGGVLRPYQQDPLSITGVLGIGEEEANPFTVRLSKESVEKIRDKGMREALLNGETRMGIDIRQPINQIKYVEVRLDKNMKGIPRSGTLDMVVSERYARALEGDYDKDPTYLHLFNAGVNTETGEITGANLKEVEAAREAYKAIRGRQLEFLEAWESVRGTSEIANRVKDFKLTPLADQAVELEKSVRNRVGLAINRMAGRAIGPYSNVLTQIEEQMARNPAIIRDPKLAGRLNAITTTLRQAMINARKSPSMSLVSAMIHLDHLKSAMADPNPESSAAALHKAMMSLGGSIKPKFADSLEHKYLVGQGLEDFKVMTRGSTEAATIMTRGLTATVDQSQPFAGQPAAKNLRRVFENLNEVLGPQHGGMADESASKLGAIADLIGERGRAGARSAVGRVGKIFSENGKAMALGLGALAALGVVMTRRTSPVASFSRSSGNKFRPEDRMGVADSIPGEPVPGQMAPSMPPRRIEAASPNVRTSVVAPLNSTSDLSVRMRSTDRSRAAETAKLLSQIPGSGQSNVTINYRDRTKIGSLRMREKIREISQ